MEPETKTQYIFPPVPSREFDWIAYIDEDEGPDGLIGAGETEQDAIDDLNEQLEQQSMSDYKHTDREASASILRAMATNPVPPSTTNVGKFEIIRNEPAPPRTTSNYRPLAEAMRPGDRVNVPSADHFTRILRGLGYRTRVIKLEDGTFNVWALAKPRIYKSL
jgi:hypothetical protein